MTVLKLAIDPGHGFSNRRPGVYDPGAVGGGLSEADIVLQWALTLKWACKEAGVFCWLTRDDDQDPAPVGQRDDRADEQSCTHFISLHCNAGGGTGTETFYRDHNDRKLAEIVNRCAVQALGSKNRGLKSEGMSQHQKLAIFGFDGPACLLEIGFIDNANDRIKMTNRDNRIAFARRLIGELKALK